MKPLYPTIVKHLQEYPDLTDLDTRLLELFVKYEKDISEMLEYSRPQNNEWAKWDGIEIEFVGPMFHKAFRQIDVLPSGYEDMEVWKALNEHSEFWNALEVAITS